MQSCKLCFITFLFHHEGVDIAMEDEEHLEKYEEGFRGRSAGALGIRRDACKCDAFTSEMY